MDGSELDRLTRVLGALRTRRSVAGLLGGLAAPLLAALDDAGSRAKKARKKHGQQKTRKKRGGARDEGKVCNDRCLKKQSRKARRNCRRQCRRDRPAQPGEPCRNGDCAPGPATCPMDGTEVVVSSYAEVTDDFAQGRAVALPAGPDAVANFLNGRFADLYAQFSPGLQSVDSPEDLAWLSSFLQDNRVHFEIPLMIARCDGNLENGVIYGYFTQFSNLSFAMQLTAPAPDAESPLEGTWEGIIWDPAFGPSQGYTDIVVTFARVSGELTGTFAIPGVVADLPVTEISYTEHRPFDSEPPGEVFISPQRDWTQYATLVGWGEFTMAIAFWVDPEGEIIGYSMVPEWAAPPDPAAGVSVETVLQFPLNGVWTISAGGPRYVQNHHLNTPETRHALDFTIWRETGNATPSPDENADAWSWEQPVFAPAAGTVVDLLNDLPDNDFGVVNGVYPGNLIVLQTAPQEFLVLGHLRQGSVAVAVGDQVAAGQFIARVGNSGISSGPHLHMDLASRPPLPYDPETMSLPLHFKDVLVNGRPEANPSLVRYDFVQRAGCPIPVPAEFALPEPERTQPNRPQRGRKAPPAILPSDAEWFRAPETAPVEGAATPPFVRR